MIPFLQRLRHEKGDCLQFALASLLELDPSEVPEFHSIDDETWWKNLQDWLNDKHGKQLILIALPDNMPWFMVPHDVECLVIGFTKGNILHACCGRCEREEFVVTHDPLTGEAPAIIGIEYLGFLVPRKCAKSKGNFLVQFTYGGGHGEGAIVHGNVGLYETREEADRVAMDTYGGSVVELFQGKKMR